MTGIGLSRIQQISMRARDIDRAVRFYRDTLGIPFLFTAPPRLAFFDCDGVRLMLSTEVWLADFEDSEGNVLALMSEPRFKA